MQAYPILSEYLIKTFNKKIVKLPIDGGFTCPNRINNKKGCLFCSDTGSGEFTYKGYSISDQIELQKKDLKTKKYIIEIFLTLHIFRILQTHMILLRI